MSARGRRGDGSEVAVREFATSADTALCEPGDTEKRWREEHISNTEHCRVSRIPTAKHYLLLPCLYCLPQSPPCNGIDTSSILHVARDEPPVQEVGRM